MRYLLPTAAAAAMLSAGIAPASAHDSRHRPQRAPSHVALHLAGHTVLSGNGVAVHGKVRPGGRHRVKVVFSGPDARVLGTVTKADGSFALRWDPDRIGNYAVRAFGVHDRDTRGSSSRARRLTSYRQADASYYGPGLYGSGVACGGTLMPGTLGVANKTLPCGTRVKLRYHGRTLTVPVIDRGPYVGGRDYDLTEATRERLGFPGVGTVLANH
jgi:rare lipoprotein A